MNINMLGWNGFFEKNFNSLREQGLVPGRILREVRHLYTVCCEDGYMQSEISGHFHYTAAGKGDYPTVGDWVAVRKTDGNFMIEKVLPRKSSFSRKVAGSRSMEQVVAANIDYLCIVCGLDGGRNFNLRGIERYIAMAKDGGITPVIVLNKADICFDCSGAVLKAKSMGEDIPVHLVSALTGTGMAEFSLSFPQYTTVAFCGHSGVGKSSLINALTGQEVQNTGSLREDDLRGRHTTTHKELFFLSGGAMVIDTPGMRELQLWGDEDSLDDTFSEISEAGKNCRFRDCTHQEEPGCAVRVLLDKGILDPKRFANYLDMRAELRFLEARVSEKARAERKAREKELSKTIKRLYREGKIR